MAALLKEAGYTAKQLSKALSITEKEVYAHLEHVEQSFAKRHGLIYEPARCLDCGYNFPKRKRLTCPSRCPVCKSEAITSPVYKIDNE